MPTAADGDGAAAGGALPGLLKLQPMRRGGACASEECRWRHKARALGIASSVAILALLAGKLGGSPKDATCPVLV